MDLAKEEEDRTVRYGVVQCFYNVTNAMEKPERNEDMEKLRKFAKEVHIVFGFFFVFPLTFLLFSSFLFSLSITLFLSLSITLFLSLSLDHFVPFSSFFLPFFFL